MDVFNTDERPSDYLEALVGEGKKFADAQALAKGKYEADVYIENLKAELDNLRAEAAAQKKIEELLAQRQATNQEPSPAPEAHQPAREAGKTLSEEDLVAKIRETLAAESSQNAIRSNVTAVAERLVAEYGDEDRANEVVRNKARELGVSVEFLQEVAAKSPKAFYAQLGLTSEPNRSAAPTKSDINPAALHSQNTVKEGTYSYYENMRKTNPALWSSARIQNEIHTKALEKGDAFFV